MKFEWSCGMNIAGTYGWKRWGGDWVMMHDECGASGIIEVDDEDVIEGVLPSVECHECKAHIEEMCHYTPMEGEIERILDSATDTSVFLSVMDENNWRIQ